MIGLRQDIQWKRTNNNPAADSDDDASERDDYCGSSDRLIAVRSINAIMMKTMSTILRDLMGLTRLQMSLLSLFVWVAG